MVCISSQGPRHHSIWHHLNRPLTPLSRPKLTSGLQRSCIDLACRATHTGGLRKSFTTTRGCRADGFVRAVPTVMVGRQRSCGLAIRAVVDDRIILTVKRVAGFVAKAQCLVVFVFGGALIDTSVGWCGSAGFQRRREQRTDQKGEDNE